MKFTRLFSKENLPVSRQVDWVKANSKITKSDGTIIFEMSDIEVPKGWSQNAVDILAQKYFRKAGVPDGTIHLKPEDNMPEWLARSTPTVTATFNKETSAKQVFHRLAGAWTYWGWKEGIFKTKYHDLEDSWTENDETSAKIFYDELYLMLAWQICAPNSPQWFNTGLHWAYGIEGGESGQWTVDIKDGMPIIYQTSNAYERPQPHACFIQPINDDLVNPGGIMDLWRKEALLFKQGSGTGTNFSSIRSKNEPLANGGVSGGLMSFLEIGDVTAKSIKSGGTTRRAAKMIVLDCDHPEILEFINWKSREEYKAACMNIGSRLLTEQSQYTQAQDNLVEHLTPPSIMERFKEGGFSPEIFGIKWQDEAVTSVSGQNSNNSIRITDQLLACIEADTDWPLTNRTDGKVNKYIRAKDLWHQLCRSTWASGDPGVQFEDEINKWHTCKADGRINASNPCCFTGDTKIVTEIGDISINELIKLKKAGNDLPKAVSYNKANNQVVNRPITDIWESGIASSLCVVHTTAGQFRCTPEHIWILDDMQEREAGDLWPGARLCSSTDENVSYFYEVIRVDKFITSEAEPVFDLEIQETHNFGIRTENHYNPIFVHNSEYLFLDNTACNLASLNLVKFRLPNGEINTQSLLHATRLWTTVLEISVFMAAFPSKEIALGSYNYRTLGLGYSNLGSLLMRNGLAYDSDEGRNLAVAITAIIHGQSYLTSIEMGKELGPFPRWQANKTSCDDVLLMHVEASLDLSKTIPQYLDKEVIRIYREIQLAVNSGFGPRNAQVTNIAPTGTISFVMDCDTTGVEPAISLISYKSLAGGGDLILKNEAVEEAFIFLGYTRFEASSAAEYINQTGTIENWATLKPEHLPIFDCANPGTGQRYISFQGHLKMTAAVQLFISGGISKTINFPNSATIEDISNGYLLAHKLKVKAIAPYRDGSKLDQPLKARKEQIQKDFIHSSTANNDLSGDGLDPVPSLATVTRWKNGSQSPPTPNGKDTRIFLRGQRETLSNSAPANRTKVKIDGHTLYLIETTFADGRLGEIFGELSKEGSTTRALLNSLAKAVSIGLQFGVPLDRYVRSFVYTKFEPAGIVEGHEHIKICDSILDFIFRHIAIKYLNQKEFANNKEGLEQEQYIISTPDSNLEFHIGETNIVGSNVIIQTQPELPISSIPISSTLEECPNCNHFTLIKTGTCTFCKNCKENSGCG